MHFIYCTNNTVCELVGYQFGMAHGHQAYRPFIVADYTYFIGVQILICF